MTGDTKKEEDPQTANEAIAKLRRLRSGNVDDLGRARFFAIEMMFRIPSALLDAGTKLVLRVLMQVDDAAGPGSGCYPSRGYMAKRSGCSITNVTDRLAALEEAKLITVIRDEGRHNNYQIDYERIVCLAFAKRAKGRRPGKRTKPDLTAPINPTSRGTRQPDLSGSHQPDLWGPANPTCPEDLERRESNLEHIKQLRLDASASDAPSSPLAFKARNRPPSFEASDDDVRRLRDRFGVMRKEFCPEAGRITADEPKLLRQARRLYEISGAQDINDAYASIEIAMISQFAKIRAQGLPAPRDLDFVAHYFDKKCAK